MKCVACGKKIKDDARFCPYCRFPTGLSAPSVSVSQAAPQVKASLGEQLSAARRRSHTKMPAVLVVILVILGIATTAFAVTYLYQKYFMPAFSGTFTATDGTVIGGTVEVPTFSFDLPDGWITDDESWSGGTNKVTNAQSVKIVNASEGIELDLVIKPGYNGEARTANASVVEFAKSALGDEYRVGYATWSKRAVILDDSTATVYHSFGLYCVNDALINPKYGDFCIGFTLNVEASGGSWDSFNPADEHWAEAIEILSSLRVEDE